MTAWLHLQVEPLFEPAIRAFTGISFPDAGCRELMAFGVEQEYGEYILLQQYRNLRAYVLAPVG